jgi:hypothetical protein
MIAGKASAVLRTPTCIKMIVPSSCVSVWLVMRSIRNCGVFTGSTRVEAVNRPVNRSITKVADESQNAFIARAIRQWLLCSSHQVWATSPAERSIPEQDKKCHKSDRWRESSRTNYQFTTLGRAKRHGGGIRRSAFSRDLVYRERSPVETVGLSFAAIPPKEALTVGSLLTFDGIKRPQRSQVRDCVETAFSAELIF